MAGQHFVGGRGGRRGAEYVLSPPSVVGAGISFHGPGVRLTDPRSAIIVNPRVAHSKLSPPSVVNAAVATFVASPIRINFITSVNARRNAARQRNYPYFHLSPPTVIGNGISFHGPETRLLDPFSPNLSNRRRRTTRKLFSPVVIGGVIVFQPIDVKLTYSRRGQPESRLFGPAVVGAGIVFAPVLVHVAPSKRGSPKSALRPPVVVATAGVFQPIRTYFRAAVLVKQNALLQRRSLLSRLFPPAIIGNGITFAPLHVELAPQKRGAPKPRLAPPAVVGAGVVFHLITVSLSPSKRGRPRSFLFPPVIPPLATPILERLVTQLVRVELADRSPHSRLASPAVIGSGIVFGGILGKLAPSKRGIPKSRLGPPVVVDSAVVVFRGLLITLASSKRGRPTSHLFSPANVGAGIVFQPIDVELTYSRRGIPKPRLVPPAIVGTGIYFYGIKVSFAPSKRGRPIYRLRSPIIPPFAPPVVEKIVVQLTRVELERRLAYPRLTPPAVVGNGIVFRPIRVVVVPSHQIGHQRRYKSFIKPPAVVQAATLVFFGPVAKLTYSKRGKTLSSLGQPALITPATNVFQHPMMVLAPRPRLFSRSRLAAPSVVATSPGPPVFVKLVPSFRRRGSWRLRPAIIPPLAPPVVEKFVTSLVRVELADRTPHGRLFPPSVIGSGIYFRGVLVHLAPSTRGKTKSRLAPPSLVGNGIVFRSIFVRLVPSRRGKTRSLLFSPIIPSLAPPVLERLVTQLVRIELADRQSHSKLTPPSVVGNGIYFAPVRVVLAPSHQIGRQRQFDHLLRPPAVVQSATLLFFGPVIHLVAGKHGLPKSILRSPAVVGSGIVFRGILGKLAPSTRGKTKSHLAAPAAVGSGIYFQAIDTTLAPQKRGLPKSHLEAPAVIASGIYFRPILVHLAPSKRGVPKSKLSPAIIPPLAPPVAEKLVTSLVKAELAERQPHPKLLPPAVVGTGIVFRQIDVELAPSHQIGRQRRYRSLLVPPAVVQSATLLFFGPVIHLAPSKRGQPRFALRPPVVVGAGIVFAALRITLAPSYQIGKQRQFDHLLQPPAVVGSGIVFSGIRGSLTYSRRGVPKSTHTFPPVVGVGIVFRAVKTNLAYSLRGKTKSGLGIPPLFEDPQLGGTLVQLVTRWTPPVQSSLAAPAVIGNGIYFAPIFVHLAPGRRGLPKSHLVPPSGSPFVSRPIDVTLAPSHRDKLASALLAPPAVIGGGIVFRGILGDLALSTRGKTKSRLGPPVVVASVSSFRSIFVHLAPSRRAKIRSLLFAPRVIGSGIVFYPISITLAPSFRRKPISVLHPPAFAPVLRAIIRISLARQRRDISRTTIISPPAVVGAGVAFRRIKTSLAYSRRGKATYGLGAPAVVRLAVLYPISVTLAPKPRSFTRSELASPAVIDRRISRPIQVYLVDERTFVHSRSNERLAHSHLGPPVVVGSGIYFYPVKTWLAPSSRLSRQTHSILQPPAIVALPVYYPIRTTLARIRPVATTFFVTPPSVTRSGVVFAPIRTKLVRIRPQRTRHMLTMVVPPHVHQHGDVCGFLFTPTEVCEETSTQTGDTGSISTPSGITGGTSSGSMSSGGTSSPSHVSGDVRKDT